MRAKLRNIIEDNTTKKGRIFDYVIEFLIFISLTAYAIETLPDNSATTILVLHWIETISVIIFTIEYVLRIYVAKKTFKYIFSFYGIIDFLADRKSTRLNSSHVRISYAVFCLKKKKKKKKKHK